VLTKSWLAPVAAVLLAFAFARHADAEAPAERVKAAEESYRQGQQAAQRGEYLVAARAFARADQLVPNPLALQAALEVSLMADDAVLGMELVDRAARLEGSPDWQPGIAQAVDGARARFAGRVGKLKIVCDGCNAVVDGIAFEVGREGWVGIGLHRVDLAHKGRSARKEVDVVAGGVAVVEMPPPPRDAPRSEAPARASEPPPAETSGVSPVFFFVGLGLTLASGAGLTASAIDTKNKHEAFELDPTSVDLKEEGERAEVRTNVMIGVTGALGLATGILAIVTDWESMSPDDTEVSLSFAPGPTGASLFGRF